MWDSGELMSRLSAIDLAEAIDDSATSFRLSQRCFIEVFVSA